MHLYCFLEAKVKLYPKTPKEEKAIDQAGDFFEHLQLNQAADP